MGWATGRNIMYFNDTMSKTVFIFHTDDSGVPIRCNESMLQPINALHTLNGRALDIHTAMYILQVPCTCIHAKQLCMCRQSDGSLKEAGKLKLTEGNPDGMTVDSNGNIWAALADKDFVACYDPDTGKPTACIHVCAPCLCNHSQNFRPDP